MKRAATEPSRREKIMYAADVYDQSKFKTLISSNVGREELKKQDGLGDTIIHELVRCGNMTALKWVLEKKEGKEALLIQNNKGQTPLHIAYINRSTKTAKMILQHKNGKDSWKIRDNNRKTPSDIFNAYPQQYRATLFDCGERSGAEDELRMIADAEEVGALPASPVIDEEEPQPPNASPLASGFLYCVTSDTPPTPQGSSHHSERIEKERGQSKMPNFNLL